MTVGERTCDLCGSREPTHLYDVSGFPIVRCRRCGLVFVGTPPRPDDLVSLYDEAYYEKRDQPGYGGYSQAEARKRHHDRSLLAQIEAIVGPGEMLEVGCAYGYFLDEARARGWHVEGIEPSAHGAAKARERFGLDVSTEPFTRQPVRPASVDVVAMWDVIEHLPNPRQTLERAYQWLRPQGVIALSTGDIGSLSARLHGPDWSLMTPPWHQFYFSRPTLRRLLEDVGFDVMQIRGDGTVGIDPGSRRPRIGGSLARVLAHPLFTRAARRLGAGSIMFAYAQKAEQ